MNAPEPPRIPSFHERLARLSWPRLVWVALWRGAWLGVLLVLGQRLLDDVRGFSAMNSARSEVRRVVATQDSIRRTSGTWAPRADTTYAGYRIHAAIDAHGRLRVLVTRTGIDAWCGVDRRPIDGATDPVRCGRGLPGPWLDLLPGYPQPREAAASGPETR